MEPSAHTKVFAVLGHPVEHSLSPAMHNASLQALGMDAVYLAFDVEPDLVMSVLHAMAAMGFAGVNLTVPLKEIAFSGLSSLDDSARRLGAVNTVEMRADGMRGHNTDGCGIMCAIDEAFHTGVRGLRVFVLGAGGAGRAVAITCAVEGAASIALADLIPERVSKVGAEITKLSPGTKVCMMQADAAEWPAAVREADLVVQATTVGMKEDDKAIFSVECFRKGQMAFDVVYMFPQTAFTRNAARAGATTANGLGMLLHQGARSFSIWTGREPDLEAMRSALEQRVYGKRKPDR